MTRSRRVVIGGTLLALGSLPLAAALPEAPTAETALDRLERYVERHSVSDVAAVMGFFVELLAPPTTAQGLTDGRYAGASTYDDYGYRHQVEIEVRSGRITSVRYDEVHRDGHSKRHDQAYGERMSSQTGVTPETAYAAYESQLLERQDLMKLDAVSGATYSLHRFRTAGMRALLGAPATP